MFNPLNNPYMKENYGVPLAKYPIWLATRGMQTSAFVPSRRERALLREWVPYWLPIPSSGNGRWSLSPNDTLEFQAVCPVLFAVTAILVSSQQPEGALVNSLYDDKREQSLINPSGPALNLFNLGGTGPKAFYLKRIYFIEPGTSLLADLTNLSDLANSGQIVLQGFQPPTPGM